MKNPYQTPELQFQYQSADLVVAQVDDKLRTDRITPEEAIVFYESLAQRLLMIAKSHRTEFEVQGEIRL